MDSFKDREKNFEKKFAHDEELQFKAVQVHVETNTLVSGFLKFLSYESRTGKRIYTICYKS